MIIVMGRLHVAPDAAAFADFTAAVVRDTVSEPGCLLYSILPEASGTGSLVVAERWRDQAALTTHLAAPPASRLFAEWGDRMRAEVLRYDAANERQLTD